MPNHAEDAEQAAVFDWAQYIPALEWLHAIPNGGNRDPREAARLKRQGVRAGVSDIFLPVPMGGYHGLYIEMKRPQNIGPARLTDDQKRFVTYAKSQGYCVYVCFGAEEAINVLRWYISPANGGPPDLGG